MMSILTSRIRAEHLSKNFKQKLVVKDVSFEVNSGEIVGLLGPNGAGKTTSFYIIAGLINANKGNVFFNEQNITHQPMHIRAKLGLGYLPQEASIFRHLSVEDNILAVLQNREDLSQAQQTEKLEQLLSEFQITAIRKSMGISLSGGERRRAEIARTLALEPKFILLDEPFAGVDPISVIEIQKIIKQLTERDIGVLITDHNVRETLSICKRAYILYDGSLIASGDTTTLLNNDEVRQVYLGKDFSL